MQDKAYQESVKLLKKVATPYGFTAADSKKANYSHVFSRDAVITGIAALLTGEEDLIEAFKQSLLLLSEHQGRYGQIPSNVSPEKKRVSYGGTVGRTDATLWFVIGCVQYCKHTNDSAFLENMFYHLESCMNVLGAWEMNGKGFVYVPPTGDWADEYIHQGYVLYDQLLYYRAIEEFIYAQEALGKDSSFYRVKAKKLKGLIRANFWIYNVSPNDSHIYHKMMFDKGLRYCSKNTTQDFWLPFFSPFGYGFRFDSLGNVLASLFGVANEVEVRKVDHYIADRFADKTGYVLPAFHPVIRPVDEEWNDLQISFSYVFRNKPYEYHNGGLWPMVTGFYVLDLALRGKKDLALKYKEGIDQANEKGGNGTSWGFFEFLHGQTMEPMGTQYQAWSAGASIISAHALKNPKGIFK
jgi:hypothetical protein